MDWTFQPELVVPVPARTDVSVAYETDPAAIGGRDVHVGHPRDRHDDPAALLVHEREQAVLVPQRLGDQLLDLVRRQRARDDELPRTVRDADLDLHADLRLSRSTPAVTGRCCTMTSA